MIATFLSQRMHDQQSVKGIFKGLVMLLQMDHVQKQVMIKIPEFIFSELNLQTYLQAVRYSILKTFELIMELIMSKNVDGKSQSCAYLILRC